jgi:sugar O-acyltransferase (sialic acid O-acetyltransferase NeuD family)
MEGIYILGSGGFAKEVYSLIKSINKFRVEAFVNITDGESVCFNEKAVPVITEDKLFDLGNTKKVNLAVGVGDPVLIRKFARKFSDFAFPNLIHPSAIFDYDEVRFGVGNIITAGVIFTTCIQVGDFNVFNLSATIGHDCKIGNCNVVNPSVNISGGVTIGDCNLLGVGSIILQHLNIGSNNTIGAAALLTKDAGDDMTLVGVPAKNIIKS